MTLCVEITGIIIFCFWVYVPITEFRDIYQRMTGHPHTPENQTGGVDVVTPNRPESDLPKQP